MRLGTVVSVGLFSVMMLLGCEEPEKDPSPKTPSFNLSSSSHQVLLDATGDAHAGGVFDRTRLRDISEIPVSPPSGGPCKARSRFCDIKNGSDTSVKPILFVTQVPTLGDQFASRGSTFANHLPSVGSTPRGGDLWIRYPNGQTRNLTKEAGFGMEGHQGAQAIAVREPTVHWDGQKAVFSMVIGSPVQYSHATNKWQMYEVTGLEVGQTVQITKVPNQPPYNNVSPLYTSDDQILFTSDRPRGNETHLYPQLDEYESTPTIVGIFKLNPQTGQTSLLNHTPSGAFSPTIDQKGRVVFIRWDHLQQDQQHDAGLYNALNYQSEEEGAPSQAAGEELFPEHREGSTSASYGPVNGFTYNLFAPWEMNQDGTHEQTLNHTGRHELSFGYMGKSFASDNHLQDNTGSAPRANQFFVRMDGGLFNMKEDPLQHGYYYASYAREFYNLSAGQIVRMNSPQGLDAEKMTITPLTPAQNAGRYRNPLPLSSGGLVAGYIPMNDLPYSRDIPLRLHYLSFGENGQLVRGQALTQGISKTLSWYSPDTLQQYSGLLWEMDPVEVKVTTRPPMPTLATPTPERNIFAQEGINEQEFKQWMKDRDLALIVVRNQTQRDRGDRQQPFNLRVPGGVQTTATNGPVYDISHFQIFQGDLVRGYEHIGGNGRRVLAQHARMPFNPTHLGPQGSVKIAQDGSSAALVPANRALSWQTTNPNGEPVVRERLWVTFQPGEIRTCSGCHGENVQHQGGGPASQQQSEALRDLLRHWKNEHQSQQHLRRNGSQPLLPNKG